MLMWAAVPNVRGEPLGAPESPEAAPLPVPALSTACSALVH
jgi:hypothetical protein